MTCTICDKQTDTAFSFDLDLPKIAYCDEHKDEVQIGLYLMIQNNDENVLERMRKQYQRKIRSVFRRD